jgi:hypothetical protein
MEKRRQMIEILDLAEQLFFGNLHVRIKEADDGVFWSASIVSTVNNSPVELMSGWGGTAEAAKKDLLITLSEMLYNDDEDYYDGEDYEPDYEERAYNSREED